MRASGVVLVVVVLLLLAADFGARRYEESQVAQSLQNSLDLRPEPQVSLHGFPFIAELIQGRISTATLAAASLTEGSITFSDIHLFLRDLRFPITRFLGGELGSIHAAGGIGNAALTNASVNHLLQARGIPFHVAFHHGRTVAQLGPVSATIEAKMTIDHGKLQISSGSGLLPTVALPLPAIFQQVAYGSVRVGDGRLVLNFQLQHPTLALRRPASSGGYSSAGVTWTERTSPPR